MGTKCATPLYPPPPPPPPTKNSVSQAKSIYKLPLQRGKDYYNQRKEEGGGLAKIAR